jgi:hypothetical protein
LFLFVFESNTFSRHLFQQVCSSSSKNSSRYVFAFIIIIIIIIVVVVVVVIIIITTTTTIVVVVVVIIIIIIIVVVVGRVSSVGIATRYGLDGPGIESRLGARVSAPVQTGPGAHPSSCTGSFPGVKRPGRGVDHPPHPAPRLKKE